MKHYDPNSGMGKPEEYKFKCTHKIHKDLHIEKYTKNDVNLLPTEQCGRLFRDQESLALHKRRHEIDIKGNCIYMCKICDLKFQNDQ